VPAFFMGIRHSGARVGANPESRNGDDTECWIPGSA
jgi:hypothetical protein